MLRYVMLQRHLGTLTMTSTTEQGHVGLCRRRSGIGVAQDLVVTMAGHTGRGESIAVHSGLAMQTAAVLTFLLRVTDPTGRELTDRIPRCLETVPGVALYTSGVRLAVDSVHHVRAVRHLSLRRDMAAGAELIDPAVRNSRRWI